MAAALARAPIGHAGRAGASRCVVPTLAGAGLATTRPTRGAAPAARQRCSGSAGPKRRGTAQLAAHHLAVGRPGPGIGSVAAHPYTTRLLVGRKPRTQRLATTRCTVW